ncbi:MAG: 2-dehydropantoate 2-reductase [Bacteroidetes bacterium]|jgi:2-dehydropantoate 2-reductase|nr:2-dehydropantoate 2-reductase [Bacteroidota bacterium]
MNDKPLQISILGIGAVGGYFGGLLAERYFNSKEVEITFITRAHTEKIISKNGLKIIFSDRETVVFPDHVTSDPTTIRRIDLLICCVKSYDLEESLLTLKHSITSDTIILPLLNGIDGPERIKKIFPENVVWEGCVYIVSRLLERGVVKESGSGHSLFFGSNSLTSKDKLRTYEKIFKGASINAVLAEDIEHTTWEKFLFISSLASLTSYLDKPLGAILEKHGYLEMLKTLMKELLEVARAKGISFPSDIIETRIAKMKTLPYETTSSMHSDFIKGGETEYKSLTGYVVKLAEELNIEVPLYKKVLAGLLLKMKTTKE